MSCINGVRNIGGPELVIGLVGPLGTNLSDVCDSLTQELNRIGYNSIIIQLSSLLHELEDYKNLDDPSYSEDERISGHMDAGTELREKTERGDILAILAIGAIRSQREDKNKNDGLLGEKASNTPRPRQAYILRSIKHEDEIITLREVYGNSFWVISVYSPKNVRVDTLTKKIAKSNNDTNIEKHRPKAQKLVTRDEEEENRKLGQNVSDAFPLADFFLEVRMSSGLREQISRFIDILFGNPYQSPTKDEFGMFFAKAAAFRSSDLSRQVGSAILNNDGDVQVVGCNEIPKYGGGQYWTGDEGDSRDFQLGLDSSVEFRQNIICELLERLKNNKWLADTLDQKSPNDLMNSILNGNDKEILKGTRILNVLEFGRSVHAEMAAISEAAKLGRSIKGSIMYVTTFPCHLCARHIVASGIQKVIYIEPYPKSLAGDLYDDSIVIDPINTIEKRVIFQQFVGLSPRHFEELFGWSSKRKSQNGKVIDWANIKNKKPKVHQDVMSSIMLEETRIRLLDELLKKANINYLEKGDSYE